MALLGSGFADAIKKSILVVLYDVDDRNAKHTVCVLEWAGPLEKHDEPTYEENDKHNEREKGPVVEEEAVVLGQRPEKVVVQIHCGEGGWRSEEANNEIQTFFPDILRNLWNLRNLRIYSFTVLQSFAKKNPKDLRECIHPKLCIFSRPRWAVVSVWRYYTWITCK